MQATGEDAASGEDDKGLSIFEKHYNRNYFAFWVLGCINNFHYCLVLSAADSIAESFNLKKYVALVAWANVFFGLFVRMGNTFLWIDTSYNWRYIMTGFQTLAGILLVSAAPYLGHNDVFRFILALVGIVFIGNGSSYGESVSLGFIERFPSRNVGGWSSGTGMSGVLAALIYLGLDALGLSNSAIFCVSIPFIVLYWSMYFFMMVVPLRQSQGREYVKSNNWTIIPWSKIILVEDAAQSVVLDTAIVEENHVQHSNNEERQKLIGYNTLREPSKRRSGSLLLNTSITKTSGSGGNVFERFAAWKKKNWENVAALHSMIVWNCFNLTIVYVFEYAAQFMAPFSFPCNVKNSSNFFLKHSFVITQFCYQIGVLCSRSSLACIRIEKVWILSIVQGVNAVMWFIQSKFLILSSESDGGEMKDAIFLYVFMFWVGLFGGASYVNVFYNILEQTKETVPETVTADDLLHIGHETLGNESAPTHVELSPEEEKKIKEMKLKEDRQLCMNIGALYAVLGITIGSIIDVLFSNTVLTRSC